jgi:hypothetical protein
MFDPNDAQSDQVAGTPATLATVATPDDNDLLDVARDLAFSALDTAAAEGVADNGDFAIRVLLLAAADIAHDKSLYGRGLTISTMLMQAMDETLAAYEEPAVAEPVDGGAHA